MTSVAEKQVWYASDFPEDERVDLHGKAHPVVGGKLRILREEFPNASVETELVDHDPSLDRAVFRATVRVRMDGGTRSASGTGVASTEHGDNRLRNSILELAETRAIARALRFFGIGVDSADYTEMTRTTGDDGGARRPSGPRRGDGGKDLTRVHVDKASLSDAQRRNLEERGFKDTGDAFELTMSRREAEEFQENAKQVAGIEVELEDETEATA